ncbi:MAG: NAD-dependent epimerase/dehydratase family protein, partial [Chitinophagaceae bacterium]
QYTDHVRLVSRHPEKINATDETFSADLNNPSQVEEAVKDSEVVYLTAGLPYNIKIWQEQWPKIMDNVIHASKKFGAKLIFFDNIYIYGKVKGPITENTPYNPCSKKGMIRLQLAQKLTNAWEKSEITGAIVRSADFYGIGANNSAFNLLVLNKLKQKSKAQWLCNDQVRYSMTFTPDAALGTALIGNSPDAMNQVWHLPSSSEPVTADELIKLSAGINGTTSKHSILKKWLLQTGGLFNHTTREMIEMLYQYENDYIFDSSKFEKHFNFKAITYKEGIDRCFQ